MTAACALWQTSSGASLPWRLCPYRKQSGKLGVRCQGAVLPFRQNWLRTREEYEAFCLPHPKSCPATIKP